MIRNQAVKHPIIFGTIVIFAFWFVMFAASILLALFGPRFLMNNGDYVAQASVECFVALAGIGLVALFGYNHIWGEKKKGLLSGFLTGGYFIYVQLTALLACLLELLDRYTQTGTLTMQPAWKIAVYIVCFLLVGFAEEVFFRGLIANFLFDKHAKNPAGVWTATIWSGLLFGLMHMINILSVDANGAVGVIVQVVSVTAMGMALTAIYYRTRNIWVVVLLHAFNNIWAGFSSGFFDGSSLTDTIGSYSPIQCIGAIPFLIVTIILLRPKKLREIIPEEESTEEITVEQRVANYSKAKRSRTVAIVVTSAICIVLFIISVVLSVDFGSLFTVSDEVLDYSVVETWSGEDNFSDTVEFSVKQTDNYDLTIRSYPGDSKVYVIVTIADSDGNEVFSQSYGGRCSEELDIMLEAGKNYTATIDYDFSQVTDDSVVSYTVIVEIED